jgi:hypothetical protein
LAVVVVELVPGVVNADVNLGVLFLVYSSVEIIIPQRTVAAFLINEVTVATVLHPFA